MPRTASRSGAAPRTARSGRRRSWRSWLRTVRAGSSRRGAVLLGTALLMAGCTGAGDAPAPTGPVDGARSSAGQDADASPQSPPPGTTAGSSADADLAEACTAFWGDPDYVAPVSRTVLAQAATASESGPADPGFYALTGDDVESTFASAAAAGPAASALADWFRTQPERGADADEGAFRDAWKGIAALCEDHSAAALWALDGGAEGTKPAMLVCADVFDTPGTLTHFANANVLTSNMFKLVGLGPRQVPGDRMDDVRATSELLEEEIAAVDDDAVRTALQQVRDPFQDALEGDTWSAGLREPLSALGAACAQTGYAAPDLDQPDSLSDGEESGGGSIVGAPAAAPSDLDPEGRS